MISYGACHKLQNFFDSIKIDSEQAIILRKNYSDQQEWKKKSEKRKKQQSKKLKPSVHKRLITCLEKFENYNTPICQDRLF